MMTSRWFAVSALATIMATATPSGAVEFSIVGPRAMGMGGAGVAVTTDSLATYWNPAGLAMERGVDLRVAAGAQVVDRGDLGDILDEIDDVNLGDSSAANQARLQNLLNRLNQPGTSASAAAAGGLYFKGWLGNVAVGMNVSDVATGGTFVSTPASVGLNGGNLSVDGQMALRGLEARQVGMSVAYALANGLLSVGATAKVIQGAAYSSFLNIRGPEGTVDFPSDLSKAKTTTAVGLDLGALVSPLPWLRLGVVAKDINEPTFDSPTGGEFKLTPQFRGGVAVNPYESLTLTVDGDLTVNKTLLLNIKSRVISVGAEQRFGKAFFLRAGALKNVEDSLSTVTPTVGFGFRLLALTVDVGGDTTSAKGAPSHQGRSG